MECATNNSILSSPTWVVNGGFLILIYAASAMFWGFALICEEYCIPAITVFCKRNNISDDIAGAIFIGAGLSLPTLFASYVGLFVTNSSIGVGTVIGGDIFNHLFNLGACIIVAPGHTMKLDKVFFTREVLFYLASNIVLIWAVKGNLFPAVISTFNRSTWMSCLTITWVDSLILVIGYVVYCIVEAYFQRIFEFICGSQRLPVEDKSLNNVMSVSTSAIALVKAMTSSNRLSQSNQSSNDDGASNLSDRVDIRMPAGSALDDTGAIVPKAMPRKSIDIECGSDSSPNSIRAKSIECSSSVLSSLSSNDTGPGKSPPQAQAQALTRGAVGGDLSADSSGDPRDLSYQSIVEYPLYKKSEFYSTNNIGCVPHARQWQLRYFIIDENGFYYRLTQESPLYGDHIRFVDLFNATRVTVIDQDSFEFAIEMHATKTMSFRALDATAFHDVVRRLQIFISDVLQKLPQERKELSLAAMTSVSKGNAELVSPDNESVGDNLFVVPASPLAACWYFLVWPMRFAIYLTVPDVRRGGREQAAVMCVGMCVVWLAVQSYVLIVSLSLLGNFIGVSSTVMGLTFGAWASSYPAMWSGVVVARCGFGDMAIGNALGSNTFSNFLGLGLPWLTYSLVHGGIPYSVLQDDGVVLSILVLTMILLLFYIMVAAADWTLRYWMVPVLMFGFVGFLVFLIYFSL